MNHDDLGNYPHTAVRALREKIAAVENLITHSEQFGDGKVSITALRNALKLLPMEKHVNELKEENEHLRAGIDLYIRDATRYQVKKRIDWAKAEEQLIYSTASELEKEIMRSVWNLTYDSVIDDAINEMLAKKKG